MLGRLLGEWWSTIQLWILSVLAVGPIPRHVAFVMDGNRRYARSRQKIAQEGHHEGFGALRRILEICFRLNIPCVTVYAFAINNFNRPKEEVEALMTLAKEKLVELSQHGELLHKYGVRLNVIGRTEMLPADVQKAVAIAENLTRKNASAILNICMPYASRDEMTRAVEKVVKKATDAKCLKEQISIADIDEGLYTTERSLPPVDVFIRTSGVKRLSDFLLWQISEHTQIHFVSKFWPDFGLLDFIPILLSYQRERWNRSSKSISEIS